MSEVHEPVDQSHGSEQAAETPPSRSPVFWLTVGFEGSLCLVALFIGWLASVPTWMSINWSAHDVLIGSVAALPLLVLFVVTSHARWGGLTKIREILDSFIVPLFGRCSIIELAVISLSAGLGEELLFRAALQGWLSDWLGMWAGLIIASIVFGFGHFLTKTYFVATIIIGLYLGWLWIATGNLMAPIITHAVYDFAALVYYLRLKPRLTQSR